ncbi:MAG TPA: CpsD/CapB family tyrosine-protein kinase [Burkholderiales bacterium]|nr:CpsD/CapB family tyrosine-protein kinase [Burkholderiales bacterium]
MDRLAKTIELAHENVEVPRAHRFEYTRTRTVPASPDALRAHHVSVGEERTPIAEAFKRLRTQLLQRLRDSGRRALGVSSPRSGEGKTTVALNLAVHTALEADWTVLLVDADLRRPGLCRALGLGPLPGLAQFLAGEAPLEELLVYPGFGRCVLLPAGAARTDSSEALGSARMHELARQMKRRYPDRLVIFDLPPLLDAADGIAALPCIDALLLVVEEGRSAADDVVCAAQLAGERLIGTVLNKSSYR